MQLVKISAKRIKQLGMFPLVEKAIAWRKNDPFYQDGRKRTFFQALVHEGVVLGIVGWEYNSEKLFLGPIEVNPIYRGIGVGRILICSSIIVALDSKVKGVFLYCKDEYVGYYKKFGFKRIALKWDDEESNEMLFPLYGRMSMTSLRISLMCRSNISRNIVIKILGDRYARKTA